MYASQCQIGTVIVLVLILTLLKGINSDIVYSNNNGGAATVARGQKRANPSSSSSSSRTVRGPSEVFRNEKLDNEEDVPFDTNAESPPAVGGEKKKKRNRGRGRNDNATNTSSKKAPISGRKRSGKSSKGKENEEIESGGIHSDKTPLRDPNQGEKSSNSKDSNKINNNRSVSIGLPKSASSGWDDDIEPFLGSPVGDSPPWRGTLNTATFIDRFDNTWFIVDCWHHRILVSNDLEAPIASWGTLQIAAGEELVIPHSMATDGRWILTESSNGGSGGDNHTVLIFTRDENGKFVFHNSLLACPGNKARRPHRLLYHKPTRAFYLYLTSPPHIAKFAVNNESGLVENNYCQPVAAMMGSYARSITIVEDSIFVTAGRTFVTEISLATLEFKRYYSVSPLKIKSDKMNDITFIDGWWYATSTVRCNIFRFRNLYNFEGLQILTGQLNLCYDFDRSQKRCRGGTPYYITKIAGRIFVPYIFHCSGIVSFVDDGDAISDIQHHWGNGWVEQPEDLAVRGEKW